MPTVRDVLTALESIAPRRYALAFDKVGLQVGDENAEVKRATVALDRSIGAVERAIARGSQMLVTHHPLIFEPLATVDKRTHEGRAVLKMIQGGINFAAAHTNWDAAVGGINDTLCSLFDLDDVEAIGMAAEVKRLKLVFFCPDHAVEKVVDALTDLGAGAIGAYRRCAFSNAGTGTFIRPNEDNPVRVDEIRLEMVLPEERADVAVRALRKAHPYEEPAYDLLTVAPVKEQPLGRVGDLGYEATFEEFAQFADAVLSTRSWAWGEPKRRVRRVAVVGGAADSDWIAAHRAGADVFLTGEVRHHVALEATESGMAVLACGHYATEQPGAVALGYRLAAELPEIEWNAFVPEPGRHGRPFTH